MNPERYGYQVVKCPNGYWFQVFRRPYKAGRELIRFKILKEGIAKTKARGLTKAKKYYDVANLLDEGMYIKIRDGQLKENDLRLRRNRMLKR